MNEMWPDHVFRNVHHGRMHRLVQCAASFAMNSIMSEND